MSRKGVSLDKGGGGRVEMAPITVVMFVSLVGWGKNVLCEDVMRRGEGGGAIPGEGLMQELGLAGSARVLEGDELKGEFWPEVGRALQDESISLLILNRNFPPNSWTPSIRKVRDSLRGRRATRVAVVPESNGCNTHAFSYRDLAVCMSSVQGRTCHGTALDSTSDVTVKVASMFFNFYRLRGNSPSLPVLAGNGLGDKVIKVPWLKDETESGPLPPEVKFAIERCVKANDSEREAMEEEVRALFKRQEVSDYIAKCRVPPSQVGDSLIQGLKRVIGD